MNILNDNFLLTDRLAQELYHNVASQLPVVDYHNHLNPAAMAANKKFGNITELWMYDDQYKHRLMRINGVNEYYITGEAADIDKFTNWIATYKKTMGNPLYHWSQLEIKAVFGDHLNLCTTPPEQLWACCNNQLGPDGIGAIDILKKWNVEILSTSDDLLDDLKLHTEVTRQYPGIKVIPSLRSDSIVAFDSANYAGWLERLSSLTAVKITDLSSYREAIRHRLDVFQQAGSVLSDHGLDSGFSYAKASEAEAAPVYKNVLDGKVISSKEKQLLHSYLMTFLGTEYGKRGMTMQLHIGAQRFTSTRLKKIAGKYGGFAAIGNPFDVVSICEFLDALECEGALPNTILYTLNPSDNERMATLTGSFPSDGVTGKIQFGPAWWFNDHYDGISKQLTDLANYGLLNTFIGMTSDSRSFMSLSRHYYFRRVLCRLLADWVKNDLLPHDYELLGGLVANICYNNAKNLITTGSI